MLQYLFHGIMWVIPLGLFGFLLLILASAVFFPYMARRKRLRLLYLGRALIPLLPLSGILGTVWGLIETIGFMAGADLASPGALSETMTRFATALNTTFWGIVGAGISIFLYETSITPREAVEDEN